MRTIEKTLDEAYDLATKKKDYVAALAICDEVIREFPSLPDGLRKRAAILAHQGELAMAIQDISAVIDQEPEAVSNYFFRGWWQLDAGFPDLALADLKKAIHLGAQQDFHYHDQSAHFFSALALLQLGRADEVLAECAKVEDGFMLYVRAGRVSKAGVVRKAMSMKGLDS